MKNEPVDMLSRIAATLANADGLRTGTQSVIDLIASTLQTRVAFIALRRGDSSVADIIAANGLGASDFRRLESRLAKSSLWRILKLSAPVAIDDIGADVTLQFLAYGTGARFLIAVPLTLRSSTEGLLAVGFTDSDSIHENMLVKLLNAAAAMIAHAMRVDRSIGEARRRLAEENTNLKKELKEKYGFGRLIGNSSVMRQIFDQANQIARSNATILFRGASGTGKELIANAVHYNSLRSKRPFIKVSCAAQPGTLIETALFGDARQAANGRTIKSAFEQADGGTLFIDEIATLPLSTQVKVVKVIEEGEFPLRGGGTETVKVNVRLIAATNRNLEDAAATGLFRNDLLRQLSAFTIHLPPLCERKSDILLLAEHFLEKYNHELKKDVRRISTPAIDMLTAYHFPGNVRELENVIEKAVAACDAKVIHGHHLPPTLQTAEISGTENRVALAAAVAAFESDLIQDALKSTRGNVARAAVMLDSTERILGYKIIKYAIDTKRFRR